MTTCVAVRGEREVVIATDSCKSQGDHIETGDYVYIDKVFKYKNNLIAICGSVADRILFEEFIQTRKSLRIDNIKSIIQLTSDYNKYVEKLVRFKEKRKDGEYSEIGQDSGILIANRKIIVQTAYLGDMMVHKKFTAIGSGREYAYGALEVLYGNNKLTTKEIAIKAVETATKFDKHSRLPIVCKTIAW